MDFPGPASFPPPIDIVTHPANPTHTPFSRRARPPLFRKRFHKTPLRNPTRHPLRGYRTSDNHPKPLSRRPRICKIEVLRKKTTRSRNYALGMRDIRIGFERVRLRGRRQTWCNTARRRTTSNSCGAPLPATQGHSMPWSIAMRSGSFASPSHSSAMPPIPKTFCRKRSSAHSKVCDRLKGDRLSEPG